jgi:excisionase family DNA binding protein
MPEVKGDKILVSVSEAASLMSLGRSKFLDLTYDGSIPSIKVGTRRLYSLESLQVWARDEMVKQGVGLWIEG